MKPVHRLAFLAIPALAIVELAAQLYLSSRPPSFDDYAALVEPIKKAKRDGELVVMAPAWADPNARRFLGDDLMPIRDEARADATRYASALEISTLGARDDELGGWSERERFEVGKFTVRRLENPAKVSVTYDFVDHAAPPDADVFGTEPAAPCPFNAHAPIEPSGPFGHPVWSPRRFQCQGSSFFNVGPTIIADQNFKPRRCLWAHPLARGELVVRYHDVPLGESIRGHTGMYWIIERELRGAPVELTVRVDGDTIGATEHKDGDGWKLFEMPLGAHAHAPKATVELAVSTRDNRDRHFCFEADSR